MNKSKRKVEKISSLAVDVMVVLVTVLSVFILSTLSKVFGIYYLYTGSYDYSLSGSTDELFRAAIDEGKTVNIYFCMSDTELKAHSTGSEVYTTAKNFEKKYDGFINIKHVNIITRQDEDGKLFPLSKYETDVYGNKTPIFKSSVIFECVDNGRVDNYRVITDTYTAAGFAPFFTLDSEFKDTAYNGEEVIAAMVSWVTTDVEDLKHAYVTKHHGETADIAFSNLLSCAGYYIDEIDLRKKEVPDDCDLLIISNPTSDFEKSRDGKIRTEIDRLNTYAEKGGNIYVAIDPYAKKLAVLEEFIAGFGISFSTSETASGRVVRDMIKESGNAITLDGFRFVVDYADSPLANKIANRVSKYTDGSVVVRESSALLLDPSKNAKPLLVSSSSSVLEAGGKEKTDSDGPHTVAAYSEMAVDGGKTASLFVIPSVYLSASDALIAREYSNKDFTYALLDELFDAGNMPYGCKAVIYDTDTLENLTMGTARLYTALIMLVPVAIGGFGAVRLIRRKNR